MRPTPRFRISPRQAPILATGLTSIILFAWFSLQSHFQSPPVRTGLAGVAPVRAFTDPYIPDPATLTLCSRPGRCEPIPEATWPLVQRIRVSHFLRCADTETRRLPPGSPHEFAQYRGLHAIGSSLDQQLTLSVSYHSMRLGNAQGWGPWLHNGDGGLYRSEPIATLWRSSLTQWHDRPSSEMLAVDFSCSELPAS